jgi:hypothetical protein
MKAQVQAQILIYVLAIFIAGTILLYGYGVVKNLLVTQEQVQLLDFKKGVSDQVEELSYAYRDVRENRYRLPVKFTRICFADLSKNLAGRARSMGFILVEDSIADGVKKNAFLIEGNRMADAFYAGQVQVDNDFECFPIANGQLKLRFEALGRAVLISSW